MRTYVIEFNLGSRKDQRGKKVSYLRGIKVHKYPNHIWRFDFLLVSIISLPFRYSENNYIG
jgi:hypothetical protein